MHTPLAIAICEDTPQHADALRNMVAQLAPGAQITLFASGEDFLAAAPAGRFALVFLDIYMAGITGVDTARALRRQDRDVSIVFTTTSEDHALEGYRVRAMQYLVKPVQQQDVAEVLAAVLPAGRPPDEGPAPLVLVLDGKKRSLAPGEILYAEVYGKQTFIHTTTGTLECKTPMEELALLLPAPPFVRCHRAYIVNLAHAARLDGDFVMDNGDTVYVRVKDLPAVNKAWNRFMAEKLRGEG